MLWPAGWVLAALLAGCTARPEVYPPDRGRPIDVASLSAFHQGSTTRAEVLQVLGEPPSTVTGPDGTTTLTWAYAHTDATGHTVITLIMRFGPDDRLLFKFLNQDSGNR